MSFSLCDDCGALGSSLDGMIRIALFAGAFYLITRLLLELRDRTREEPRSGSATRSPERIEKVSGL